VYQLVGRTRDDAAGEAYDKVAKLLGLGYPGGPVIDRMAKEGDDRGVELPRPRFTHADRNAPPPDLVASAGAEFSFSGLKTAVLRHLQDHAGATADSMPDPASLSRDHIANLCASFQRVVVEALLDRTFSAARRLGAKSVGIAGGVSANSRLRKDAVARGAEEGLPVFIPHIRLSTDNAAMIAAAGLRKLEQSGPSALDFNAHATLPIS
jgi:N6-L-threonylcarbamoyladenine synthase